VAKRKTITYILSTNYAGSTMLTLMLGAHSKTLQIGEAKRLRRVNHKQNPCSLCNTGKPCSLFDGIGPDNIKELYDIVFSRATDIDVIVDNSKKISWAEGYLNQQDRYDIKFIHLVRDPRSLVRRWELKFKDESKLVQRWKLIRKSKDMLWHAPFCDDTTLYTYKWLCQNRLISRFLEKNNLQFCVLTYRDLVMDTENQLRRLNKFISNEYESQQATYWTTQQHGSGKTSDILHHEGIQLDVRWKDYLSPQQKHHVAENRLVTEYLEGLNVTFQDDGLHYSGI